MAVTKGSDFCLQHSCEETEKALDDLNSCVNEKFAASVVVLHIIIVNGFDFSW